MKHVGVVPTLTDQNPPGNELTFLCLPGFNEPDCCPGRGNPYSYYPNTALRPTEPDCCLEMEITTQILPKYHSRV